VNFAAVEKFSAELAVAKRARGHFDFSAVGVLFFRDAEKPRKFTAPCQNGMRGAA
jgi:hypothetical protein